MAKKRTRRSSADRAAFRVGPGTVVSFGYELCDAEGDCVESSDPEGPLTILFGYGQLPSPIERALDGLAPGQARRLRLGMDEAFGPRDPEAIFEVDRDEFPADVAAGDGFSAEGTHGPTPLKILEVTEDRVVVDANHPLAGQSVDLDIVVEAVRPATGEEIGEATKLLLESDGPEALVPPDRLLVRGQRRYDSPPNGADDEPPDRVA